MVVGVVVAVVDVAMPVGFGRDIVYCFVAASAAVATALGACLNRPTGPLAWGLLLFARSRGPERRPTALLDTAILTVGVGLLSWVFLALPNWETPGQPLLSKLVEVAYPLGNVLLFGALVRLAKAPGAGRTASRILAGSVGAILALQALAQAAAIAVVDVHPSLLDSRWLVAYVLGGAAALHPSMRALSMPAQVRIETLRSGHLVGLAAALLIGPTILAGELIAGVPLRAVPVVVASGVLVLLVMVRIVRMVHYAQDQATTDDLTGLPNRRALYLQARARLAEPQHQRQALLMLDLDRFKEVNDSLGHHAGDELLVQVGARLGRHLRTEDLLVRLGGDEFAILLDGVGAVEAERAAHALRAALSEPFVLEDMAVHSAVSIGIALFPDHGPDLSALLRKADIAMYRAKADGGVHLYGQSDDDGATRLRTVAELRIALESGQLVVHYQPKVDLRSGEPVGVEALVRWNHPTRGLLFPDSFLDLVEEAGLMRSLTRVVLTIALDQVAAWRAGGRDLTVAVNLSASSLVDVDLPDEVAAMLADRRLPPVALQLEITEEFLLVDRDRAWHILGRLRDNGIQIAVDDFGTGYSSPSYLRDLPIDELKLDQSFVFPMAGDARATALVASIIALGHSLDLRIVAEGVENAVVLTELTDLGCDQAQGYYLTRPLPAADFDAWLDARTPPVDAEISAHISAVLGA